MTSVGGTAISFMERARKLRGARTPLPTAIKGVLETLVTHGGSCSITGLASETSLNRRTVEKAVNAIVELQKFLDDKKIVVEEVNRTKLLRLEYRHGLRSVPDDIQRLLIRSAYFPVPSREQEILTHLYLRHVTSPNKALKMERTELVLKLVRQGQLARAKNGAVYLTEEGLLIAKGTLDIYPELRNVQSIS